MMKKGITIVFSIIIALALLMFVCWRLFIHMAGAYVIDTLVESVDDNMLEELQVSLGEIETPLPEETETIEPDAEPEPTNDIPPSVNTDSSVDKATDTNVNTDTNSNIDTNVPTKIQIDYADKMNALKLAKSKFSMEEIMAYKDRYFSEGLTSELMSELKATLKARCSADEIKQIKEWYNKYKQK